MKTLIHELIAVYTVAASVALAENLPMKFEELDAIAKELQQLEEQGVICIEFVPTLNLGRVS